MLLPSNDISSSRVSTPRAPGVFPGSSRSAVPTSNAGAQTSVPGHYAVQQPSPAAAASRPSLPSYLGGPQRLPGAAGARRGEGTGWPPQEPRGSVSTRERRQQAAAGGREIGRAHV